MSLPVRVPVHPEGIFCHHHPHDLVTALMVVDQYEQLQDLYQDSHGQLIQFSLLNIINEILAKSGSGLVVHVSGSRYLLLFHNEKETRSFHLMLRGAE